MRLEIAAIAACVAGVNAFKNTSPFVLFTSSESQSLQHAPKEHLQSASHVLTNTKEFLKSCPSDFYYIITQPSLSSRDVNENAMPQLHRTLNGPLVKSKYEVSDVLGLDANLQETIEEIIQTACGLENVITQRAVEGLVESLAEGKKVVVANNFWKQKLSHEKERRLEVLRENDDVINTLIQGLPKDSKFTVIYTSTAMNSTQEKPLLYEPEFNGQEHIDLKRDMVERVPQKTVQTDFRPLFEKYQFFTPGIFMGLIVAIIFFMILSVGLSAVSSLQVSYGAFEKEMGPGAQRKQ